MYFSILVLIPSLILTQTKEYLLGSNLLELYLQGKYAMICHCHFFIYVLIIQRLGRNEHMYYGIFCKENDERFVLLLLSMTSCHMSLKVISSANVKSRSIVPKRASLFK